MIDDSTIKSPVQGRVQYRLVEPGAVLPPGGKIATVIDLCGRLHDRIPSRAAGWAGSKSGVTPTPRASWWTPPRNTFSPPRSRSWPPSRNSPPRRSRSNRNASSLSFVSSCKSRPALLKGMEEQIKSGLRAVAYVRLDPTVEWPSELAVKLPPLRAGRPIGRRDDDCAPRDGKAAGCRRGRRLAYGRDASLRQDGRAQLSHA